MITQGDTKGWRDDGVGMIIEDIAVSTTLLDWLVVVVTPQFGETEHE